MDSLGGAHGVAAGGWRSTRRPETGTRCRLARVQGSATAGTFSASWRVPNSDNHADVGCCRGRVPFVAGCRLARFLHSQHRNRVSDPASLISPRLETPTL